MQYTKLHSYIYFSPSFYFNFYSKKTILLLFSSTALKKHFSNPSYIPYAYKIRKKFETSPISGKRDYNILKKELNNFYKFNENNELEMVDLKEKTKIKIK